MAFWGSTFVFDGIPSETFDLYISSPDGGEVETSGSSNVNLITQEIFRRSKPYFYGVQQSPVLSFPITVKTPNELKAIDAEIVQRWLFGQQTYKKLQIMQEDMQDVYFNCFLTEPSIVRVGNIIRGFNATVTCDSPFAWGYEKTITYSFTSERADSTVVFNNLSDDAFYLYPKIEFTMNGFGGDFSIFNLSDNNREFAFSDLLQEEKITINNDLQIIDSSTGLKRLTNFNKKWFRFLPKINRIRFLGNISSCAITYQFAKKIGG